MTGSVREAGSSPDVTPMEREVWVNFCGSQYKTKPIQLTADRKQDANSAAQDGPMPLRVTSIRCPGLDREFHPAGAALLIAHAENAPCDSPHIVTPRSRPSFATSAYFPGGRGDRCSGRLCWAHQSSGECSAQPPRRAGADRFTFSRQQQLFRRSPSNRSGIGLLGDGLVS